MQKTDLDKNLLPIWAIILLLPFLAGMIAGPAAGEETPVPVEGKQAFWSARQQVDRAWDVYHHAALGGTLASPALQSALENRLHEARALLAQAWEALEKNRNRGELNRLLKRVDELTRWIIEKSRETKR